MTPFRNKRLIILLGSFIILVALIGFSIRGDRKLTLPEQFVKDTVGFVQMVVDKPTQYVISFIDSIQNMRNMYEENRRLKARLDGYLSVSQKVADLEAENKELREVLGKTDEKKLSDFTPIQATVIARNPDQWNDYVIINRGETDGIKVNMAVMTAQGLIGRIKSVSQFTSTVQLLSDGSRTNRISAAIQGDERISGLIKGYAEKGNYLLFTSIPSDTEIKKGQIVATSGLSGVFPSNLVIGTVEKVEEADFGLTQTAYVKPAADFYNINHVIVVERLAPSGDTGGASE